MLWFFGIGKTAFSIADHFVTMTIVELDFFSQGHSVLRVNIHASSFYSKLCAGISDEEMDEMKIEIGDNIIMNMSIIKKIWNACLEHGYILQHYDFLVFFCGHDNTVLK